VTTPKLLGNARESDPQYAPDGSVYFISDGDGFSDIYSYQPKDGSLKRVTHIATGVSGITSMGPAISVADRTGDLGFAGFTTLEEFHINTRRANRPATPVEAFTPEQLAARTLPPIAPDRASLVSEYLADADTGLQPEGTYDPAGAAKYKP